MRHSGKLKPAYIKQLQVLSLPKIAREAAMYRSIGRRCGAVTALILDWAVKVEIPARRPDGGAQESIKYFFKQYYKAWDAEQQWRNVPGNKRELDRPVIGERRPDSWKQPCGVLDLDWDYGSLRAEPKASTYA